MSAFQEILGLRSVFGGRKLSKIAGRIKPSVAGSSDQLTERGGIQVARTIVHSCRASTERTPVGAGERRQKKISVIVPLSEAVLDWLVSKKHLAAKERENDAAIKHAIESLLSASAKSAAL
jgi:hypothetical protein